MKFSANSTFRLCFAIFLLTLGLFNGKLVICVEAQGSSQIEASNQDDGCTDCPSKESNKSDQCDSHCCIDIPIHSSSYFAPKSATSEFTLKQIATHLHNSLSLLFSPIFHSAAEHSFPPSVQLPDKFPILLKNVSLLV